MNEIGDISIKLRENAGKRDTVSNLDYFLYKYRLCKRRSFAILEETEVTLVTLMGAHTGKRTGNTLKCS